MSKFSTPAEQRAELLTLYREGIIDKDTLRKSLNAIASESLEQETKVDDLIDEMLKDIPDKNENEKEKLSDEMLKDIPDENEKLIDEILKDVPEVKEQVNEIKRFEESGLKKFYHTEMLITVLHDSGSDKSEDTIRSWIEISEKTANIIQENFPLGQAISTNTINCEISNIAFKDLTDYFHNIDSLYWGITFKIFEETTEHIESSHINNINPRVKLTHTDRIKQV